jgi:hypothetical protein
MDMNDFDLIFTFFFQRAFLYMGIAFAAMAILFAVTRREDVPE